MHGIRLIFGVLLLATLGGLKVQAAECGTAPGETPCHKPTDLLWGATDGASEPQRAAGTYRPDLPRGSIEAQSQLRLDQPQGGQSSLNLNGGRPEGNMRPIEPRRIDASGGFDQRGRSLANQPGRPTSMSATGSGMLNSNEPGVRGSIGSQGARVCVNDGRKETCN